jgi:SAM-dependent methyltransferase
MKRTDIINLLINKVTAKNYLEIGVSDGKNFADVICENKTGVDPEYNTPATIHKTSDDFFKDNTDKFDIIFVDGLHHADQVYRDIKNSLKVLNKNGYIVCHDMNPMKEEHQTIPYVGGHWNGDCWKALVQLRQEHDDLEILTIDTDQGCGIISFSNTKPLIVKEELTYENLTKNRKDWLNLISVNKFLDIFSEKDLRSLLLEYVNNPNDPETNFSLALYYDAIGQTASALSYYLRTAERTDDDILKYECLIKGSMCFNKQGTRKFTVKGMLQHAIAILPKRPEAYYMMSVHYEKQEKDDGKWFDSYLIASIGVEVSEFDDIRPLRTEIDYKGKYQLLYQKATTSWWCGLCEESKKIFLDLHNNYELDSVTSEAVFDNLSKMKAFYTEEIIAYDKSKIDGLKVKFDGLETIERNYSEAYQDMFVLTMLNGKREGTYLEIGAGNTFYGNNTALLEQQFDWTGISLDVVPEFVEAFCKERKNQCILRDATSIDYDKFLTGLGFDTVIDYLQIDCDPAEISLKVLHSIPFEKFKFRVITFEHDYYADKTKKVKDLSRKFLESYGYRLVASDISPDDKNRPYEDWWVHKELVDNDVILRMTASHINMSDLLKGKNIKNAMTTGVKKAEDFMMGKK